MGLSSVPAGIDIGTQVLVLTHNQFEMFSWASYVDFPDLHELDLSHNQITALEPPGSMLRNLSVLRLSYNKLSGLGGGVFRSAPSLMEIYLDGNSLRSLHDSTFGDLPILEVINLSQNQIPALPRQLLDSISSTGLKTLDLEQNNISSMPDGFFSSKPDLPYVYLSSNPWECSCQVGYLQTYLDDQGHNVYKHAGPSSIVNEPESVVCASPPHLKGQPIIDLKEDHYCNREQTSSCSSDRNEDHRPRVSCVNMGLSSVPAGIDIGTQVLVLTHNQFEMFSWASYVDFPDLHELDLSHNQITALEPPGSMLRNLSVLRLSYNKLSGLGGGVFRSAPSLMEIYLDGNSLRSLHDSTFSDLPILEVINLSQNQIPALPRRLLDSISSTGLKTLDLEQNNISSMPDGFFSSKPDLPYVYLSSNPWECSCQVGYLQTYLDDQGHNVYKHAGPSSIVNEPESVVCASPPHLKGQPIIDLKEDHYCNREQTSSCSSDRNEDHRPRVSCVNMGLSSVPAGIDIGTQVLVLTHNQFEMFSWASYVDFPDLHELDLSHNQITALEPPGSMLRNLSVLRLSYNKLSGLGGGVFRSAPSLMEIYLDGNSLRSLHDSTFGDLPILEVINLSQNQIPALPRQLLDSISSTGLKTLDLEQNNISSMPDGFFSSKPDLPYVYLSSNPWECSCQVGYLQTYLDDQGHNVYKHAGPSSIVNEPESVVCASPPHLKGQPIIDLKEDHYCNREQTSSCSSDRNEDHRPRVSCVNMGLSSVPAGIDIGTQVLVLTHNQFEMFSWASYVDFPDLHELDLSHNQITALEPPGSMLRNLSVLRLSYNKLSGLGGGVFRSAPSLMEIYLDGNSLRSLHDSTFGDLPILEVINLSQNQIPALPRQLLDSISSTGLKTLDLEQNNISSMPDGFFSSKPDLPYVYLSSNPWECSCQVGYLQTYLDDQGHNVYKHAGPSSIVNEPESVVCASPPHLKGQPIIDLKEDHYCNREQTSSCSSDRNEDHRPRVSCVNMGLSSVPAGIDIGTQVLVLTHNQFEMFSWASYVDFPDLHELDLSHNQITALEPPGSMLRNLSVLRLSYNKLSGLGGGVFRSAPSLMEIYLDGNSLRSLHDSTFSDLPILEVINLSQNQIPALPRRLLDSISSTGLKTLDLEQNNISSMPDGFFSSKPDLPYVYLSSNPWECSCQVGYLQTYLDDQGHNVYKHAGPSSIVNEPESVVCASPPHLKGQPIIDLKEDHYCNREQTSSCSSDRNEDHRPRVSCVNMGLSSVPAGIDIGTQVLVLTHNQFEMFSWASYVDFPDLHELDLSHNQITALEPPGSMLRNLSVLRLSYNKLSGLGGGVFRSAPSLMEIYLDGNSLRSLHDSTFSDLPILEVINLSQNQIPALPRRLLDSISSTGLKTLDLEQNNISSMPDGFFSSKPDLPYVYLSSNPWECSCQVGYLQTYLDDQGHNVYKHAGPSSIVNEPESVVCASPPHLKGQPIIDLKEDHYCNREQTSSCSSDRNEDHRPRVSCVNMGLSSVPAGIDIGTQVLVLTHNQFEMFSWASYVDFPDLHELDLSHNQITALEPPGSMLRNLSVLRLSYNKLSGLGGGVFRSAPSLMEIYLDGNSLRSLHDSTFGDLPILEVINLSQNQIPALPRQLLDSISSTGLKTLDLEQNNISSMPDGFFSSKPDLPYVYLSSNPWECSCQVGYLQTYLDDQGHNVYKHAGPSSIVNEPESVVCASPPHLKGQPIIDLKEDHYCNREQTSSCSSDRNEDHRPRVSCVNMGLSSVPAGIDIGTQVLVLTHNQFEMFSWASYVDFPDLHELDLSHNQITALEAPGSMLRNLSVLRLSYNKLSGLGGGVFRSAPSLMEIYLDGNSLRSLHDSTFSDLPILEVINLSQNQIPALPRRLLDSISSTGLKTLDLEQNNILSMPDGFFSSKPDLPYVYLSSNPWECSCQVGYLQTYLDDQGHNVYKHTGPSSIVNDPESVVCASPPHLKGQPIIDFPHLDKKGSQNHIQLPDHDYGYISRDCN
ncbi:uncharacterized protein gp1ba [Chanos chanos]|uniref:Uncharacterized protein gp1ba n=1 Tax=Chanos chanos TaxID=29144 RepID=A0A6J2VFX4_CHACN|nr:uncharacterized protein LOC115812482 [Chanos chanos]